MAEITYNSVYDAVSMALHPAFPMVHIHEGTVEQDLQPGDFAVIPVSVRNHNRGTARAERSITVDVIYYPPEENALVACLTMADRLSLLLDTVTTPGGDKLHCQPIEPNITEDVMHSIVSYSYFVYDAAQGETMETLGINEGESI